MLVMLVLVLGCGRTGRRIICDLTNRDYCGDTTMRVVYPKFNYSQYKTVAVVGNCDSINSKLESILVGFQRSPYTVIERSRLALLLKEQGLWTTDGLSVDSASRVDKITGVDALIITDCRGSDASVRMVDTTSGRIAMVLSYEAKYVDQMARDFYYRIGPYESYECSVSKFRSYTEP